MAHKQPSTNAQRNSLVPSSLPKLSETSFQEQQRRRFRSNEWRPHGFDRYRYQNALLGQMAILGGIDDNGGGNPDRYTPVGSGE